MEENIAYNLFSVHYLETAKQKVYLLPENFDQLSNLNTRFVTVLLLLIDIYSS